ncbi:NAD(P)H-quinone oxidoreductase subunit H chloroplastic [Bienertia sinuspersici]
MNREKPMTVPITRKDLMIVNMGLTIHQCMAFSDSSPEQLGNIQVPKRASYIEVIMLSVARERELIYDLFEAATERVENVGIIGGEEAKNWGLLGPILRASRIQWDLRKVDHYECYDEFDWEVQWQEGDLLARYLIRIGEMIESVKIIQQALEGIPGGPYENLEIRRFNRMKYLNGMILNIDSLVKIHLPLLNYQTRTLCKSRSPKGRIRNLFDRRSERFSLEMENSPARFYQFANSS